MSHTNFSRRYDSLRKLVDRRLASLVKQNEPRDLSDGSRYVLLAPGKRVRSTLLLLSCEVVGGDTTNAVHAAAAIEMLHNFTLVHDDVMDNASSRRGRATVHIKWDINNAILVGDVILGLAYRSLLNSNTKSITRAIQLFTNGFIDVCEGQAFDLEYERRTNIRLHDYYRMIGKKTGALISAATELGAVIGNGTPRQTRALRSFGKCIGKAFQIQDDLLDVVADERDFGKKIGGDIIEGKKTFLLVHSLANTRGEDHKTLLRLMTKRTTSQKKHSLVKEIASIYKRCGAIDAAQRQIKHETAAGLRAMRGLPASPSREMLQWFSEMLVQRTF